MRRAMAVCFWVCLACSIAGAAVGVARVWGLATEYEVSEVRQTILIVFAAAAVTMLTGRVCFGGRASDPRAGGALPGERGA